MRPEKQAEAAAATVAAAARGEDATNARRVDPSQGDEAITPPR